MDRTETDWSKVEWLTKIGLLRATLDSHSVPVPITLGIFPTEVALALSDFLMRELTEGESVCQDQVQRTVVEE